MKIEQIIVETEVGVAVRHFWLKQDSDSQRLLVLLPGRGYTLDSPMMHYLRSMSFDLGYDVLNVQYSFQFVGDRASIDQLDINEIIDRLTQEADGALTQVLASKTYQEVCIVGKSLGSPLASTLINRIDIPRKKLILLTPILTSVEDVGTEIPTLIVIGTNDGAFVEGQAENDKRANVRWKVYPDLNHALEYHDDWRNSVTVLSEIIGECEDFLA